MKLQSFSLLFAAVFILSACGGSGGTSNTSEPNLSTDNKPTPTSNSSSSVATNSSTSSSDITTSSSMSATQVASASAAITSSSISSSSSSVSSSSAKSSNSVASSSCSKIDGNIFIDCTDLAWNGPQAYEQTKDYKTEGAVTDGTQGQIANWHSLVSTDQGHDNVIEVQFKDNDNYNANVHFYANATGDTRDMSAYATGKLIFDIKLLNAGKYSPKINVMTECIYPCISHEHHIDIPALDQWVSVEVPIAELIEGGLDITKTGIGFEILPEWNKQNGVKFQLDNIRWVKSTGMAPTPEAHCYEQRFETWGLPYSIDTLVGSPNLTNSALTKIISTSEMTPNWSATTDKFGYAPKTDNSFTPCAYTDGRLSAQVYLPKSYVDDGNMRVGLYYQDSFNRRAYFPSVSASSFAADAWKTISSPLVTINNAPAFNVVDNAFNLNDVNYVGVYFDANGKPASVGGRLKVDNIFISGKPVTPNIPSSNTNVCNGDTQSFSGATPTGMGFASSTHFFVRADLNNATFSDTNQSVTSINTQSTTVVQGGSSGSTMVIFDLTTNSNGIPSTQQLQAAFNYQAIDANSATSVTFSVYSTASDAVNSNHKLSINTITLAGGANCISSSSSSSAPTLSSSSTSSSSAISSSSSTSSSVASVVSSSSSSASSLASCSVKTNTDSSTLGFGLISGSHAYLVMKLGNANYASPSPQVSIANTIINVAFSNSSRIVYDITANSSLPSSTAVSFSFGFQQLDSTASVSRTISLYDTATAAMNESTALTSGSATIAAPGCL